MCPGGQRPRKFLTRENLCEAVYKKVGLSRSEPATLAELVLKEITDQLEHGETVKLSSFGPFVVQKKGPRMGRNPRTGKEVSIPPHKGDGIQTFHGSQGAPRPYRGGRLNRILFAAVHSSAFGPGCVKSRTGQKCVESISLLPSRDGGC